MNNSFLEKRGTVLCSSLLEMCVQTSKLIFSVVFVLELVKCVDNPETIAYRNSSNHENCNIIFSLNTFLIKLPSVKFLVKFYIFVVKHIYTWKVNIWVSYGISFFYFILLLKWNKKEIFNKRIQERDGCRETFLEDVTGNSESDY